MRKRIRLMSALLALIVIVSGTTFTASAVKFTEGSTVGTGTVTTAKNVNLTTDGAVTYAKAVFTDSGDRQQAVYAMEFNPTTSNYMPYAYSKYTGTGCDVYRTAQKAESQFGVNVIGGINATFYATSTGSTYAGYWVHDGRLAQATVGYQNDIITFDSNGQLKIVNSKLDFKLFLNGREVTSGAGSGLVHINKKSVVDGVDNRFYYWDTECGTKTDSVIAGLEILCKKLDYGQLSIGNTLKGEVKEIRKDSFYSAVGEDEFVLYVKNDSPLKAAVESSLALGDIFEISVNEAIEASRQYTEKSNTSIVAQYPIVKNGVKDTAEALSQLGAGFMTARAQRCSIGVKADGTVVLISGAGRNKTDEAPGLNVYELADIMVQLGCVTAYNLDGGGSTQMVTKEDGTLDYVLKSDENTYGRNVANCIYIVERKSVDTEVSAALEQLVTENESNTSAAVVTAITEAKAVVANTKSLTSDYTRAYMDIKSALSGKSELDALLSTVSSISFKYYTNTVLEQLWEAYDEATAVRANKDATVEEVTDAINNLETLYNMKSDEVISEGMYLTGFNTTILTNNCMIFTPDYATELTTTNANLNWARAIAAQWSEELQSYVVIQTAHGNGSNAIKTVPENGFVLGVHGDTGDGDINKTYANTAKVGDKLVLYGIDIEAKTARAGAYITIESSVSLKTDSKIALDGTFAKGAKNNQTVDQICANFNGTITVKDKNGNVITGEALVGTGSVLIVGSDNYIVVIKGEINGDGKIDSKDYMFAKKAFLGTLTLTETQLEAACLEGTPLPTSKDYMRIKRHFLETYDIFAN